MQDLLFMEKFLAKCYEYPSGLQIFNFMVITQHHAREHVLELLFYGIMSSSWSKPIHADENSAKEEARRHVQDGNLGYSNADVVVKLQGWDADQAKSVAQASLSALKQLILSDRKLPGTPTYIIELHTSLHTSYCSWLMCSLWQNNWCNFQFFITFHDWEC